MAKKRVRRVYSRMKRVGRRHRTGGGLVGEMMTGAVLGAGVHFATPVINSYVPSVMGLRPTTLAVLGGGIAAKTVLHKGGKFASGAVVLGTAMAVSDLIGSMGGGSSGTMEYL